MRYFNQNQRPLGGFRIGPAKISPFIKVMLIANTALFILQSIIPDLTTQLGLIPALFFSEFPNKLYQRGMKKFARFYILSGLCGAILTLIVQSDQMVTIVGASAAIYGVLVAYWLMFPNRMIYIYFVLPVKVKWAIPGLMLLGFLLIWLIWVEHYLLLFI